jgi:hypothetical protein
MWTLSRRRRLTIALACVVIALSAGSGAGARDQLPRRAVLRVPPNDPLTAANLARLARQSATARDMLARLEAIPDAAFTVRAHPLLMRSERLLGRGRFWIVGHRLFGVLEYQAEPEGNPRALRVLAHELAHALEVGMLPRARDTRALESRLRLRQLDDDFDSALGIETD